MKRYLALASQLEQAIEQRRLQPGERLASVRQAARQHGLSVSSVVRAYALLESKGLVLSRPQSGYYVRDRATLLPQGSRSATAALAPAVLEPSRVDVSELVLSTLRSIRAEGALPLGSPYPDPAAYPQRRLQRVAASVARRVGDASVLSDLPPGNPELIRQIVRRYLQHGEAIDPDEVVITVGATEAINLCLQAVARPGDAVAVESPTYYAMLHAIERMGMRVVEIPTDPEQGIDLDALRSALAAQRIAALMVMPNFQNPLGFEMPLARKLELVRLIHDHRLPTVENDVYQELYHGRRRPPSLKSLDTSGLVLHCSSFSKSLSSSYRIGWAIAGRYRRQVERLKFLNTLATPSIPQLALAEHLDSGSYDRHLRRVRALYRQNTRLMRAAVLREFPTGTWVSQPAGGYLLWLRLHPAVDSMQLYRMALDAGITVGPGRMFSAGNRYRDSIRLNCSYPWSRELERALRRLGEIVEQATAQGIADGWVAD